MSVLLYAVNVQGAVQLENDGTRGFNGRESHVRTGAHRVIFGMQLHLDAIVRDIVTRAGNWLLLGRDARNARQRDNDGCAKFGEQSACKHRMNREEFAPTL